MLELDRTRLGFKMKTIYFAERPYDVEGADWVNFFHIRKKFDAPGFVRREYCDGIIDLSKGPEQIWNGMANKCRSDIRRSEKDDITISINENFEDFIRLNSEFRKDKGIPPVEALFRYYLKPPRPDFWTLFTAEHQGEIIAGILFINDDRQMQGILGPSKRFDVRKEDTALIARTDRRLWWEAMKWGSEHGLQLMDMGNFPPRGTDPEMEGVAEFKRRFGAQPMYCYGYLKLYSRKAKAVDKLRSAVRSVTRGGSTD
jgi:lipid II:glycine glycyltransferase (peptidoglycan interpeptide bridge formation enzyme)